MIRKICISRLLGTLRSQILLFQTGNSQWWLSFQNLSTQLFWVSLHTGQFFLKAMREYSWQHFHTSISRSTWCVCVCMCVCESLSCVWIFVTPWTIALQAPLPSELSRQEYWSGLPIPYPSWQNSRIHLPSKISWDCVGILTTLSSYSIQGKLLSLQPKTLPKRRPRILLDF